MHPTTEDVEPLPKKKKTLFNFMESDSSFSQNQNQPSTLDKMGDYSSAQMSTDPAKYWRRNIIFSNASQRFSWSTIILSSR